MYVCMYSYTCMYIHTCGYTYTRATHQDWYKHKLHENAYIHIRMCVYVSHFCNAPVLMDRFLSICELFLTEEPKRFSVRGATVAAFFAANVLT